MPTDIVMPQMGESIFEGTITKWLKKPGEKVQRDEPLFEISTDKVDAEIPAPATGVLSEIKVPEGSTVQVNTVVGVIDGDGAGAAAGGAKQATAPPIGSAAGGGENVVPAETARKTTGGAATTDGGAAVKPSPQADGSEGGQPPQTEQSRPVQQQAKPTPAKGGQVWGTQIGGAGAPTAITPTEVTPTWPGRGEEAEEDVTVEGKRIRSSPLVRKLAREHGVNLAEVPGTGLGGRITKEDILAFVSRQQAAPARPTGAVGPTSAMPRQAAAQPIQAPPSQAPVIAPPMGQFEVPGDVVAMTPMRKKIAERMVESKRISPHVHTVYEVDMTRVVNLRAKVRAEWERRNATKLTFMPFIARALTAAIRQYPIVNSSVEGDSIHYHRNINLGIAVALDWGLIVPVIKKAEELNFLGLQRAVNDLSERARTKRLAPDDVAGGTITITNPGSIGGLIGFPIIMQPQVAILGTGGIKKEPVVVTDESGADSISIRSMMHIVLGYDHRIIDGATAGMFLGVVKKFLETWNEDIG